MCNLTKMYSKWMTEYIATAISQKSDMENWCALQNTATFNKTFSGERKNQGCVIELESDSIDISLEFINQINSMSTRKLQLKKNNDTNDRF